MHIVDIFFFLLNYVKNIEIKYSWSLIKETM